jgi:hypothetical protein
MGEYIVSQASQWKFGRRPTRQSCLCSSCQENRARVELRHRLDGRVEILGGDPVCKHLAEIEAAEAAEAAEA